LKLLHVHRIRSIDREQHKGLGCTWVHGGVRWLAILHSVLLQQGINIPLHMQFDAFVGTISLNLDARDHSRIVLDGNLKPCGERLLRSSDTIWSSYTSDVIDMCTKSSIDAFVYWRIGFFAADNSRT